MVLMAVLGCGVDGGGGLCRLNNPCIHKVNELVLGVDDLGGR